MTTDQWVRRLNKLALEMDEAAESMHPSAWVDGLAPLRKQFLKLAQSGAEPKKNSPQQIGRQLSLFDEAAR